MKVYINGEYFEKENAKISVFDHGLLYGDGLFEGLRIYNGKVFRIEEHIERLYKGAKAILLSVPISKDEMIKAINDSVRINNKINGYIRLILTRGEGALGIDPDKCEKTSIIIIVGDIQLYPSEFYEKGIFVVTAGTRKISPASFDTRVKSLNYINNIMAKIEAKQAGVLESIMLNEQGYVVECTADNIFIVSDKKLLTPPAYLGALDGITRNFVIELAEKNKIEFKESMISKYDLYTADECFLTGTGAEVMPVVKIDGRVIGNGEPGEVTKKLLSSFRSIMYQS